MYWQSRALSPGCCWRFRIKRYATALHPLGGCKPGEFLPLIRPANAVPGGAILGIGREMIKEARWRPGTLMSGRQIGENQGPSIRGRRGSAVPWADEIKPERSASASAHGRSHCRCWPARSSRGPVRASSPRGHQRLQHAQPRPPGIRLRPVDAFICFQ
jgi:hypothetical protein